MNWPSGAVLAICMNGIVLPFALSDTGLSPYQCVFLGLALAAFINLPLNSVAEDPRT